MYPFVLRKTYNSNGMINIVCFIFFLFFIPPERHFIKESFKLRKSVKVYQKLIIHPQLWPAFAIGGLHFFIFVAFFNYIGFYLSEGPFFLSSSWIGLLYLSYLAGTLSSAFTTNLTINIQKAPAIQLGILVMSMGIVLTLFNTLPIIALGLTITAGGFFFVHSISMGWVSRFAKTSKASASSLYLLSYYIGGGSGSFYLGWFWKHYHWEGVVGGTILILILTSLICRYMKELE